MKMVETTTYKVQLNEEEKKALNLLHTNFDEICNSGVDCEDCPLHFSHDMPCAPAVIKDMLYYFTK